MTTLLRESTPVARKVHHCGTCGLLIKIGERHHVATQVYDGRVYDWRTCQPCADDNIVAEVYFWAGSPDEGVGIDEAWEWAHDCLAHPLLSKVAAGYLARNGCSCERCEPER